MFATVERARPTRVGDLVLAEAELVDELAVGVCGLDRVEILALEVLDERELELVAVGELADDRRDAFEAGGLRGPEPALAGDELVAVEGLGHEDRLDDAVLGDARRQRRPGRRRRTACAAGAGSGWIRPMGISIGAGLAGAALRDERREAAAEALRALGSDCHDVHRRSVERRRLGTGRSSSRAACRRARGARRRARRTRPRPSNPVR